MSLRRNKLHHQPEKMQERHVLFHAGHVDGVRFSLVRTSAHGTPKSCTRLSRLAARPLILRRSRTSQDSAGPDHSRVAAGCVHLLGHNHRVGRHGRRELQVSPSSHGRASRAAFWRHAGVLVLRTAACPLQGCVCVQSNVVEDRAAVLDSDLRGFLPQQARPSPL